MVRNLFEKFKVEDDFIDLKGFLNIMKIYKDRDNILQKMDDFIEMVDQNKDLNLNYHEIKKYTKLCLMDLIS